MKKAVICLADSELGSGTRGSSLGPRAALLHTVLSQPEQALLGWKKLLITHYNVALGTKASTHCKYLTEIAQYCERLSRRIEQEVRKGSIPCILTGDHSSAIGIIYGLLRAQPQKRLGIVWIDAHPDLHSPFTSRSGNVHGMPLAAVTGLDNTENQVHKPTKKELNAWSHIKKLGGGRHISPEDIVFVGARDIDPPEAALISVHHMHQVSINELRKVQNEQVCAQIEEKLAKCDHIFISFDVDSMDKALVPGTGTPVEKGLSVKEAHALNQTLVASLLRQNRLAGWEMTELNPLLDIENQTTKRATKVLSSVLQAFTADTHVSS